MLVQGCGADQVLEKLGRMLASRQWSRWLEDTMKAFTAGLAGVSENRVADVVVSLLLAEYGSSVYAAERLTGSGPGEAYEAARRALCSVYEAALRILEEGFRGGELEKRFSEAVRELTGGGGGAAGQGGAEEAGSGAAGAG